MTLKIYSEVKTNARAIFLSQTENLPETLEKLAAEIGLQPDVLVNDFKAEAKEILLVYASGTTKGRVFLVGLGKKNGFADIQLAARSFCHKFKNRLPTQLALDLRNFSNDKIEPAAEAAAAGVLLGLYQINKMKTEPAPAKPAPVFGDSGSELHLVVAADATVEARAAAHRAEIFSAVQKEIFDLVNAPGNRKTPAMLADFAKKAGEEAGFSVKILDKKALLKEGLHALLAVNQGSPNPPALILLDYVPKGWPKKDPPAFGLVGKGVTFDTGGISIKHSTNMHYMKSDMGGAAAVLGAFMAAAKLKLPLRLTAAIPTTENMVDGMAAKPGDVVGSYAGKTIEITDTDAEGRVILADGLAYLIKNRSPKILLDLATLTGSIVRAIGTHAGGLFTQNDELAEKLLRTGQKTGERLWRMPLWEEYGTDLKSDVADLRNFTGKPMAECITAAKFLENFTQNHAAWAHLDIAGVAFGDSEFANEKSATAYGVRLLTELFEGS